MPPHVPTQTSVAAAIAMQESAGTLRAKVLGAIRDAGMLGMTDEQLQASMPMPANTQRPRRRELQLAGLIRDSGMRAKTKSGRNAVVWVLA
jgi:hypothetical protein